jgi:mono/diheme cytochrome c family protein
MASTRRLVATAALATAVLAIVTMLAGGAAAQGASSVWDGVYSPAQATRGERVYVDQCLRCHGSSLLGGGDAPALTGPLFAGNWDGVPLSDLFDRIRTTMPQERPGSLSRQDTADVIAYMLKAGGVPAGSAPLATQSLALGQIVFASVRPQR